MQNKPIFIRVFGDTPKIRILNSMLKYRGLDYSMSDIARNSKVGWATLSRLWQEFIKLKVVLFTRKIGRAKLYRINEENLAIQELIKVYKALLVQETKNYFKQKQTISIKY